MLVPGTRSIVDVPLAEAIALTSVALSLRPPREAVRYEAVACWEAYANGDYRTSTVTKHVALGGRLLEDGDCELDIRTAVPVLAKPEDLESLEALALRLAPLYARVVVQAAPTGQLVALRNHDALLHTWEQLARDLLESAAAEDRITPTLVNFVSEQLQSPAKVVQSLRHDYLYAALVPDFYAQPLGGAVPRTQEFSQFFDKLPLWFSEQVAVFPAATGDARTVVRRGKLDTQQTDVAAIRGLMAAAAGPAADPAVAPHFHYEATHVLDQHTGLPQRVDLTVYGRLADCYNKQYTLTLTRV
ncbi:MAG TPA: hypothetical protein VF690_15970 [Hymenobacter sp.]